MSLILPEGVARDLVAEREAFRQQLFDSAVRESYLRGRAIPLMREFNARLKRIDKHLELVMWPDNGRTDTGMRPGFYYIVRDNPGAPPTWMEIHADGEWCEPTSRCFDRLAEGDLWNSTLISDHLRRKREEYARNEAELMRIEEERQDHLRELVNAATRTQVSMTDAQRWSQNVAGRRGRREPQ